MPSTRLLYTWGFFFFNSNSLNDITGMCRFFLMNYFLIFANFCSLLVTCSSKELLDA